VHSVRNIGTGGKERWSENERSGEEGKTGQMGFKLTAGSESGGTKLLWGARMVKAKCHGNLL